MKRPRNVNSEKLLNMGSAMKMLRRRRQYTIADVAGLSRYSGAFISKLERGHTLPEMRRWLRLAQILCKNQSEYDEIRGKLLASLAAVENADYEFLPTDFEDFKVIDVDSSEIPRGVLGVINPDQSESAIEETRERIQLELKEIAQNLPEYTDARVVNNGTDKSCLLVYGDTGDVHELIYVVQHPMLQAPRSAWLQQMVGRIVLDEFYQRAREKSKGCVAIIYINNPFPEILKEHERALNGLGISFGSTIYEARVRFVVSQV